MKNLFAGVFIVILLLAGVLDVQAKGTVKVKGYVKKSSGKYVTPHFKTSPDKTKLNNWSTKGNVNPYTGKKGTK